MSTGLLLKNPYGRKFNQETALRQCYPGVLAQTTRIHNPYYRSLAQEFDLRKPDSRIRTPS
eukprot:6485311-Pyramimonas_sp.AAC.1